MNNLFTGIPSSLLPDEIVDVLVGASNFRIERIISTGQASPDDFWYDQELDEWVVVLKGAAKLLFEGDDEPVQLRPGDYTNIPAHTKHRVDWTAPDDSTVWLAVFYQKGSFAE